MTIIFQDTVVDAYMTVEENGRVNYYYENSFDKKEGAYDVGAVLRAAKAWKAWVKEHPGEYWCAPARPELEKFYKSCFPDVRIRKQDYSWGKLIGYPLLVFTLLVFGVRGINNIYLSSLAPPGVTTEVVE